MSLDSQFELLGCNFKHNGISAWEGKYKDTSLQIELVELDDEVFCANIYFGSFDIDNAICYGSGADAEAALDDAGFHYVIEALEKVMDELESIKETTVH